MFEHQVVLKNLKQVTLENESAVTKIQMFRNFPHRDLARQKKKQSSKMLQNPLQVQRLVSIKCKNLPEGISNYLL